MKKIILLLCLITTISYGQKHTVILKQTDTISVPVKFKPYISIGVSLSNNDKISDGASQSIEVGFTKENISLGLSIGRDTFNYSSDKLSNYYVEPKITGSLPFGVLTGTLIFGVGKYINSTSNFIEYGSGLIYSVKQISYGITYSNFNKVDYISPSITYTFN